MKSLLLLLTLGVVTSTLSADTPSPNSLKEAARGKFYIGVAINSAQIQGQDRAGVKLIEDEFNSISPENTLKWAIVHPQPGEYDFSLSDHYVDFGTSRGMFVIGHTLMWH